MATSQPPKKRRGKRKADAKAEPVVPQIVTKTFADNVYTGVVQKGSYGLEYLDCPNATYQWKVSGVKYEGPFVASRINGKGKFAWPDGSTYEGELLNGKRHGEGVYVSTGGYPTYEGQWCMGKRNGRGKLMYDADGSYYEGQWCKGEKDGDGYQAWPSGNVYRGQWKEGKMRGQGTMLWREAHGLEEYTGNWDDNKPHGEGTHIWHAPTPTAGGKPVQQQLNNRYTGQFRYGQREGFGTFYYANGSYYSGGWKNHQKSGQGRHTYEDGRFEEGIFLNDRMYGSPTNTGHLVLPPYYAEDNPICRCTDLSDLAPFAYPEDCSGIPATAGTGYADGGKIFREAFNMLLRHIGELKEVYARYRALLPIPGEDPFVLASVKLWAFARDFGMLTPTCSLVRFNRAFFSGPRNHREVAPEDMTDIRPVTPRNAEGRRYSLDGPMQPIIERPASVLTGTEMSEAEVSSIAASSPRALDGERPLLPPSEEQSVGAPSDVPEITGAMCESKHFHDAEWVHPSPWRRQIGTQGLDSPHNVTRPRLYRQFLDGLVRACLARYPHERGLESQIHRFFRELMVPGFESQPVSEPIFASLVVPDLRRTLDSYAPLFMQLFCGTQPRIESMASEESDESLADRLGVNVSQVLCMRSVGDYGAAQRRLHIQGRLDTTVRVKDILQILDGAGLLLPTDASDIPSDPYASLFPGSEASPTSDLTSTLKLDDVIPPASASEAAQAHEGASNEAGDAQRHASKASQLAQDAGKPTPSTFSAVTAGELASTDMRCGLLDVLRVVGDMYSSGSIEAIKLSLDPGEMHPNPENISLLEYMETEIAYPEFERLLVALADVATGRDQELCTRLSLAMRFEAYLRHVFAPGLLVPYVPPLQPATQAEELAKEADVAPEAEAEAEAPDASAEADAAVDGGPEDAVADDEAVECEDTAPRQLELWTGFGGQGAEAFNLLHAARRWPEGYESDVMNW